MKNILSVVLVLVLGVIAGASLVLPLFVVSSNPAYAIGTLSQNCTVNQTVSSQYSTSNKFWDEQMDATTSLDTNMNTNHAGPMPIGWYTGSTEDKWRLREGYFSFNYEAPPGEIQSWTVTFWVCADNGWRDTNNRQPFFKLYSVECGSDYDVTDWNNGQEQLGSPLCPPFQFEDADEGTWVTFDLTDSKNLLVADEYGKFNMAFMWTNQMYDLEPEWQANDETMVWVDGYEYRIAGGNGFEPYMTVNYIGDAPDLNVDTSYNGTSSNNVTDNMTGGVNIDGIAEADLTIDSIEWGSPRAGYADGGLFLYVLGDSGVELNL